MNKFIYLSILILLFVLSLSCEKSLDEFEGDNTPNSEDTQPPHVSVTLTSPGSLKSTLKEDALAITSLKIKGYIDGNDIALLREMGGNDKYLKDTKGKLETLDLSEAIIVDGGFYIVSNTGDYVSKINTIPDYAFYNCSVLRNVSVPNNVTSLGQGAFRGCINLEEIRISETLSSIGKYCFYDCFDLNHFKTNQKITNIPIGAFFNCRKLTEFDFSNLTSIGDYSFSVCKGLTTLNFSDKLTYIGDYAFQSISMMGAAISLPKSLTYLGAGAFQNSEIEEVTINSDLDTNEDISQSKTFYNCTNLKRVSITEGVTKLNTSFHYCESLEIISLPTSLRTIGYHDIGLSINNYIFSHCTSLKQISLPANLEYISQGSFSNCTSLSEIELPDKLQIIEAYLFEGCTSLQSIKVANKIVSIGNGAFKNCPKLQSFTIPASVKGRLGDMAFEGCSSLTEIVLTEGIESIGDRCFSGDFALSYVYIPSSVTSIGENCFFKNINLTKVCIRHQNPLKIPKSVFEGVVLRKASLEVPLGTSELYRNTSPWSSFATIIEN